VLKSALAPGGHAIIATFGPDGPQQCSGLEVCKYDAASMHQEMPEWLDLVRSEPETHQTPWGANQAFHWFVMRSLGS
jgi:hypothetical protein